MYKEQREEKLEENKRKTNEGSFKSESELSHMVSVASLSAAHDCTVPFHCGLVR